MKEEAVTTLAREYAEESAYEVGAKFDPQDFACTNCAIEAKNVIKFLLRRYCLVEKEAVRKEYDLAEKLWMKSACTLTEEFNRGRMNAIESLFPEIAKEVEE